MQALRSERDEIGQQCQSLRLYEDGRDFAPFRIAQVHLAEHAQTEHGRLGR